MALQESDPILEQRLMALEQKCAANDEKGERVLLYQHKQTGIAFQTNSHINTRGMVAKVMTNRTVLPRLSSE